MPFHEFKPLHELVAVLQSLCPWQELTPIHLTNSPAEATIGAEASIAAAAAARAKPVVLVAVFIVAVILLKIEVKNRFNNFSRRGFSVYPAAIFDSAPSFKLSSYRRICRLEIKLLELGIVYPDYCQLDDSTYRALVSSEF